MNNRNITSGQKYDTKGGWLAYILGFSNGNAIGYCIDNLGEEEPNGGTWDVESGKCLHRGDFTDSRSTEPYDILTEKTN